MKELKIILGLIFFSLLTFISCTEENIDVTEKEEEIVEPIHIQEANPLIARSRSVDSNSNALEGLDFGCFTISFPLSLIEQSGTSYEVINLDEFNMLMLDSTLANELVDFVYPLQITYRDGSVGSIDDAMALGDAFATCVPVGEWTGEIFPAYLISLDNSCYQLEYPVSLNDIDGEEIEVSTETELIDLLAKELVFFAFPLTVLSEDGEALIIADVNELFGALTSCSGLDAESDYWGWESNFEMIGCYTISFPFDVILNTDDVVTVDNHEQLCELLLKGEIKDYAYPITLVDFDENEHIASGEDDLSSLLASCEGIFLDIDTSNFAFLLLLSGSQSVMDELGNEIVPACWEIVFPIELTTTDFLGNTDVITVNTQEELFPISTEGLPEVNYPISVITLRDSLIVEIENITQLLSEIEKCGY